jgi:zinc protease
MTWRIGRATAAETCRRRTVGLGLIALLLTATVSLPGAARAGLFDADSFTLENGMQVVVIENHRAPVVVHMVWYRVGAADDPPGKSGIAHFLEHLMFKGTERVGPGEFSRELSARGGVENAFTSADYTAYFQRVARDHLEFVMDLEADRMRNLVLTDEIILPERAVILEERSSRIDNNPRSMLGEQVGAAQFLNHPYGTPIIGWRHEVATLDRSDATGFYDRHYAPNNAILIVAGDITVAELRPLAEKYYGVIPPVPEIPARNRPQEPPQISPRRVFLTDDRAPQAQVSRSYLAPSYRVGETQHAIPLEVLAEVLGAETTSRLYQSLVVERSIAPFAGASYRAVAHDATRFVVYAAAFPGQDIEPVETALDEVIAELLAGELDEAEVEAAKARMIASATYALDNPQSIASIYGSVLTVGLDIDLIEQWPERVAAVTRDQVLEAARAVLQPERSVTGILYPGDGG